MRKIGILLIVVILIVILIIVVGQKKHNVVITLSQIEGIVLPASGGRPVKTISETEQYTGVVSWLPLPADDSFEPSTEYTATIILSPKKGFTISGVPKDYFRVNGAKTENQAGSVEIKAYFPKTMPSELKVITLSEIPGVVLPLAGDTAPAEITSTDEYTGSITWTPVPGEVFDYSTEYTALIELITKEGYTFSGIPKDFFKIEGARVTNEVDSGLIMVVFPKTADEPLVIDISRVMGVESPRAANTAATHIAETSQYSGSISWVPPLLDNCFDYNTKYTAKIKLKAKPGYTLNGVEENYFNVDGASATNDAGTGLINAIFPATKKAVTIKDILGVPLPSAKRLPKEVKIETDQYEGEISWQPEISGEGFEYNTEYKAIINLRTKPDYTFAGLKKNFFNVDGAKAENETGSGIITVVFPATEKEITLAEITALQEPVAGEVIKIPKIETSQYTGSVRWSPYPADKVFDYFTEYTAHIELSPKPGYTLNGLKENFFLIKNAKLTNNAESGVVTAVFRKTLKIVYNIGDTGPAGGKIFYIDESDEFDWKYLEISPYNATLRNRWGDDKAVKGKTKMIKLGDGRAATDVILASGQTNTIAECADEFVLGGYDDWFCPTIDELVKAYKNLVETGIYDTFDKKSFWSANEDGFDTAFTVSFFNGSCSSGIYKSANKNLLFIRSF